MNSEVNQLARALDLSLGGWAGTTRESRHGFYSVKDDGAAARSLGVGGMHGGRADGVGLDAFMHGYGGHRAAAAGSKARVMLIATVVRSAFLLVFVDMIGDRARPHFAAPCASARDSVTAPHCAVRTTDCVSKSFHT